jgi:hypothetical protein
MFYPEIKKIAVINLFSCQLWAYAHNEINQEMIWPGRAVKEEFVGSRR